MVHFFEDDEKARMVEAPVDKNPESECQEVEQIVTAFGKRDEEEKVQIGPEDKKGDLQKQTSDGSLIPVEGAVEDRPRKKSEHAEKKRSEQALRLRQQRSHLKIFFQRGSSLSTRALV